MRAAARPSTSGLDRAAPAGSLSGAASLAPIPLSTYAEPPDEEISLEEFESFAMDRLFVLRLIEALKARGLPRDELSKKLDATLGKQLPLRAVPPGGSVSAQARADAADDARKDRISHYVLRLAYSRTEDLRRWFLKHECDLFKHRLEKLAPVQLAQFARQHAGAAFGGALEPVADAERAARREALAAVLPAQLRAAGHGDRAGGSATAMALEVRAREGGGRSPSERPSG